MPNLLVIKPCKMSLGKMSPEQRMMMKNTSHVNQIQVPTSFRSIHYGAQGQAGNEVYLCMGGIKIFGLDERYTAIGRVASTGFIGIKAALLDPRTNSNKVLAMAAS